MSLGTLLMSICLGISVAGPLSAQDQDIVDVTVLDRGEPYASMLYHADHLFVGKSRLNFNSNYRIEIYSKDMKLVKTIPLTHASSEIKAYNATSVISVGIRPEPQRTEYTIIDLASGTPVARTVAIPIDTFAFKWFGRIGSREYFSDPGGFVNDPEARDNPTITARTLFHYASGRSVFLPVRISRPLAGVTFGNGIFLVQGFGINSQKNQIVWTGLNDAKPKVVLNDVPSDISDLILSTDSKLLLSADRRSGKIVAIDTSTHVKEWEISIGSGISSLSAAGSCVVASDADARSIHVVDMKSEGSPRISYSEPLNLAGEDFATLNKVSVDMAHGRVFARSNFACNPLTDLCSSDFNRVVSMQSAALKSALASCL